MVCTHLFVFCSSMCAGLALVVGDFVCFDEFLVVGCVLLSVACGSCVLTCVVWRLAWLFVA